MVYGIDPVDMPDEMKKEVERLIDQFKARLHDAADEVLGKLYVDIAPYLDSDFAQNYRNDLRAALAKRFASSKPETSEELWAKEVREAYFMQHREELEKGLVADAIKERDQYKTWYQELLNSRSRF